MCGYDPWLRNDPRFRNDPWFRNDPRYRNGSGRRNKPWQQQLMVLVFTTILLTGTACAGASLKSLAADRQSLDITVYNHGQALVREVRRVQLPRGDFRFEFGDVPAAIVPASLLMGGAQDLRLTILEQNYEYDLLSPERILAKYVGQKVAWVQEDGSRLSGTLLGINGSPVYNVGGEILFELPGRLALPELPSGLYAQPTLVWLAHTNRGGTADVETSYLTGGIGWQAEYVLQLDASANSGRLQAWVSVDNQSGATFANAHLALVAGTLHRARNRIAQAEIRMSASVAAPPAFKEETLYDYHLYSLQRPTTLKDKQSKQISLMDAPNITVTTVYRVESGPRWFRNFGNMDGRSPVAVYYQFQNVKDNSLGVAMPAGLVRIYGRSKSGARQFLGEDRIGHTPADEQVALEAGEAFDIVVHRSRSESKRLGDNFLRHTFTITLRNHKSEDVVVEVIESVGGFWEVTASSHAYVKLDDRKLKFGVPISAKGEQVLRYTVEVTY